MWLERFLLRSKINKVTENDRSIQLICIMLPFRFRRSQLVSSVFLLVILYALLRTSPCKCDDQSGRSSTPSSSIIAANARQLMSLEPMIKERLSKVASKLRTNEAATTESLDMAESRSIPRSGDPPLPSSSRQIQGRQYRSRQPPVRYTYRLATPYFRQTIPVGQYVSREPTNRLRYVVPQMVVDSYKSVLVGEQQQGVPYFRGWVHKSAYPSPYEAFGNHYHPASSKGDHGRDLQLEYDSSIEESADPILEQLKDVYLIRTSDAGQYGGKWPEKRGVKSHGRVLSFKVAKESFLPISYGQILELEHLPKSGSQQYETSFSGSHSEKQYNVEYDSTNVDDYATTEAPYQSASSVEVNKSAKEGAYSSMSVENYSPPEYKEGDKPVNESYKEEQLVGELEQILEKSWKKEHSEKDGKLTKEEQSEYESKQLSQEEARKIAGLSVDLLALEEWARKEKISEKQSSNESGHLELLLNGGGTTTSRPEESEINPKV